MRQHEQIIIERAEFAKLKQAPPTTNTTNVEVINKGNKKD